MTIVSRAYYGHNDHEYCFRLQHRLGCMYRPVGEGGYLQFEVEDSIMILLMKLAKETSFSDSP